MNRYEQAIKETQSVLDEWLSAEKGWHDIVAKQIVERLIAKGVIQSTDPDDLVAS